MLVHDFGSVSALRNGEPGVSDMAPAVHLRYSVVTLDVNSISSVRQRQRVCVTASHYQQQAKREENTLTLAHNRSPTSGPG